MINNIVTYTYFYTLKTTFKRLLLLLWRYALNSKTSKADKLDIYVLSVMANIYRRWLLHKEIILSPIGDSRDVKMRHSHIYQRHNIYNLIDC